MEEALKVSIGGVSFIINRDAFNSLDSYLRGIENHYANREGGREIVEDIESRIAELLLEKHTREDVVTLDRVDKVISVMGTPSQFEDEEENGNAASGASAGTGSAKASFNVNQTPNPAPARRLYRDTNDRILGGVCSGIAHYFKFDPVFLRIILAAVLVLRIFSRGMFRWHSVFGDVGGSVIYSIFTICVLTYLILWIAIPSAKTYTERCQMMGSDPGVRGAEENYINDQRPRGWWLGRVIKVLLGLVFICMGLLALAVAWGVITGSDVLFGANPVSALGMLDMQPWLRILLKVCFLVALLIPCLVFLYLGIRWLFNIKKSRYHLGLIAFLVWLLAVVGCVSLGGNANIWAGRGEYVAYQTRSFPKYYDTLYVQYAPLPEAVEGESYKWEKIEDRFSRRMRENPRSYVKWNGKPWGGDEEKEEYTVDNDNSYIGDFFLYVSKGSKSKRAFAIYPKLDIDHKSSTTIVDDTTNNGMTPVITRDTTIKADLDISIGKISFLYRWNGNDEEDQEKETLVDIQDSLITLKPMLISKKKKYDGTYVNARLCIPDSSVVIIKTPKL